MSEYEKTTELQEQQFGFKKFSSTTHAIYTLRETIRVRKLEKKKTYALFLDFSKAFDKVNKSKFLVKLAKVFEPKLWLAICNYYENAKLIIKSNEKLKHVIEIFIAYCEKFDIQINANKTY